MSYVQGGFVARWGVSSQSGMYSRNNKKVVSIGGTCKCPVGHGETYYASFRGGNGIVALGNCFSETTKFAYFVDDYKISWSSDVMSYGTSDFDCYRLQMNICTFKVNNPGPTYQVVERHEYVVLNSMPNQVVTYEGKLPIAIPVNPRECLGVQISVSHMLGSEETISTATFDMVFHVTAVDDGSLVYPQPYPW